MNALSWEELDFFEEKKSKSGIAGGEGTTGRRADKL